MNAMTSSLESSRDSVSAGDRESTDYHRVEHAMSWLAEHFVEQPSLAEIAAQAGLSEFHFQRLFSRWVGLSPKKFLQFLTLQRAKQSLSASRSVLDAAFDAGLSGSSRLHDLFVTVEAMTPGEYKARGRGLTMRYGFQQTPFGQCVLMQTDKGICGLAFVAMDADPVVALSTLRRGWENAELVEDRAATARVCGRIFGSASEPRLKLLLRGTPFQIKVWEALLAIPEGGLTSYEDVARAIGRPRAVRAVANAVGGNGIAYLIPCHRVIRKSGLVGGYRWGPGRKLAMLGWEAARAVDAG